MAGLAVVLDQARSKSHTHTHMQWRWEKGLIVLHKCEWHLFNLVSLPIHSTVLQLVSSTHGKDSFLFCLSFSLCNPFVYSVYKQVLLHWTLKGRSNESSCNRGKHRSVLLWVLDHVSSLLRVLNLAYVSVSLIAIVIQCLISSILLTLLSLHSGVFYQTAWQPGEFPPGFPYPWQSNVATNLIKSPTHLNPIMQISVCKAVKSLSGNVNVVRIVPDDWNLDLWICCFLLFLVNRDAVQCWMI